MSVGQHLPSVRMAKRVKKQQRLISCACKCGGLLLKYDEWSRKRTYINGNHAKEEKDTRNNSHITSKGYIMKKVPKHPYGHNGYVMEHRLVMEEYYTKKWLIPFYIHPSIHVHHKDGNPKNNEISNLQLISKSDHMFLHSIGNKHSKKDMSNRVCLICGSKTTYLSKKGYHNWLEYKDGWSCHKCYKKIKRRERTNAIQT